MIAMKKRPVWSKVVVYVCTASHTHIFLRSPRKIINLTGLRFKKQNKKQQTAPNKLYLVRNLAHHQHDCKKNKTIVY